MGAPMRLFLAALLLSSMPTCTRFRAVVLTEEQSDPALELKRGQEFGVRLKTDPASGNTWHLVERGGAVLVAEPVVETTSGDGANQLWRFRADKVRESVLKMEFKRPKDKDAVPTRRFSVRLARSTDP